MKRTSKILAAMLAVLLIACMLSTGVFAAETPSDNVAIGAFNGGTVTINASNADDSFALYKVIDITYDANNSGSSLQCYAWNGCSHPCDLPGLGQ